MQPYARRGALRAFACQRCLAQLSSRPWTNNTQKGTTRHFSSSCVLSRKDARPKRSAPPPSPPQHRQRQYGSSQPFIPENPEDDAYGDLASEEAPPENLPIRERLREYIAAEPSLANRMVPRDAARTGTTENNMTRVESRSLAEIKTNDSDLEDGLDSDQVLSWGGAGIDGDDDASSMLARPYGVVAPQAGDLIEVSTDSWRVQLLAVCLGNFRGIDHFYTNTGKWFASSGVKSLFAVTRFATQEELAPLIEALPAEALQEAGAGEASKTGARAAGGEMSAAAFNTLLNTLQDLKLGPSREAGAGLLKKMADFAEQAAGIHMSHAGVLDNAFDILEASERDPGSPESKAKPYMTLDELASILLRRQGHGPRGRQTNHRHHFQIRNLRGSGSGAEGKDEFTAPAMYAVYRAIIANDLAFRPLSTTLGNASEADDATSTAAIAAGEKIHSHSRSCLFTVASREDINAVNDVTQAVRHYYDLHARSLVGKNPAQSLKRTMLGSFIHKARVAIDRSRATRAWSPYGMLSTLPATRQPKTSPFGLNDDEPWSPSDMVILHFMHLWASSQRFSPVSRLQGIASSILRALDRYSESEFLVMSTGWTFLQEVGWVLPWDIPGRYKIGLPDIPPLRCGGLDRSLEPSPLLPDPSTVSSPDDSPTTSSQPVLSEDIFEGRRKDWGDLTAFCIDAPEAEDIDDAIALERIAHSPDEFWVHAHVADPASRIRPGSTLAEQAARMPQTAYLPGFQERMFPDDIVRQQFSLAPGQPCLTFSARVNRQGNVLESKITPGRLGRTVFITPSEVASVVAEVEQQTMRDNNINAVAEPSALDLPWTTSSFSVGEPPEAKEVDSASPAARQMTTADELSPEQKADLETLSVLATALRAVRLANGAMPLYWPRPSVAVSLDNTEVTVTSSASEDTPDSGHIDRTSMLHGTGNPYIRIWYEGADAEAAAAAKTSAAGSRLVESIMRLAGEVTADWCHERGIAIPFRGQPDAVRNIGRLRELTRNEIYPALISGKRPGDESLRELRRLLGADDMTAVSVPHVTMGVARYTKATSPLRRYADLLVHWQVEGALLADMERGDKEADSNSANGEPSSAVGPPFTRHQLEHDILPLLRVRERALRTLDNRVGRDQWILQAMVRAWLGEEPTVKSRASPESESNQAAETAAGDLALRKDPFSNLHFTVSGVNSSRGIVNGRLDWFEQAAVMDVLSLNPTVPVGDNNSMKRLTLGDIEPGQVYPVNLAHVDVHGNMVLVNRTGDAL